MCKKDIESTLDATRLFCTDVLWCFALMFCDVMSNLLLEWAFLSIHGDTNIYSLYIYNKYYIKFGRDSCLKSEKRIFL